MARRDRSAARAPTTGRSSPRMCQGLVEGDGLPEGDLVALEGDLERRHARHSGLVRYLGRVSENEATMGRGLGGQLRGDAVDKRRFRATGGVAAAAAWSGIGRRETQDRARLGRKPVGLAGDKRSAMT